MNVTNLTPAIGSYVRRYTAAVRELRRVRKVAQNATFDDAYAFAKAELGIAQKREEIQWLFELVRAARPRTVLEIGLDLGGTLFLWSRATAPDAHLIAIDNRPVGRFGKWSPFSLVRRGFAVGSQRMSLLMASDSHTEITRRRVAEFLGDRPIEFLFIDGDHSYDGVCQDFNMYSPLMAPGGLIAFHDISPNPAEWTKGVARFWREFSLDHETEERVVNDEPGFGIGIYRVPKSLSRASLGGSYRGAQEVKNADYLLRRDYAGHFCPTEKMLSPSPFIPSVRDSRERPFWSVMIPTYNARTEYLEETLKSILQQDPGPDRMQIEVVDDCSNNNTAFEVTRRVGAGRVTFHAERQNRGLANAWNRCIERARGHWVHILHHDDVVLPGFYQRLYDGIVCIPDVGMAFSRFAVIDADGHWIGLGPIESTRAGVLNNWLERIATGYHLECPAVVVKRATYERLGGFTPELVCFLDVEMWVRIAANAPVYYEPQILAIFRRHGGNVHLFQEKTGENLQDMAKAISIWKNYLPVNSRGQLEQEGRRYWADVALMLAQRFFSDGDIVACINQLRPAKDLCNRGRYRSGRLRLEAKVLLHRAFGPRAISAMRKLRRQILPR